MTYMFCGAGVIQLVSVQALEHESPSSIPDDSASLFQLLAFL